MSKDKTEVRTGGIGFFGLLTIVFITLKLIGYINWSWWWVLSPLWIPLVGLLVTLAVVFIFIFIWEWATEKK